MRGGPVEADCAIAVIGSRAALAGAIARTNALCRELVERGVVVVSGGAVGIDAAAHRAVLEASGRTWAIVATGPELCFPACHADLFDRIGAGPGAVLWPFRTGRLQRSAFLRRNRILAALSDAVVVMQAGEPSGALHAAGCARKLGKPVWVVAPPTWTDSFAGSRKLLEEGAIPLLSVEPMLKSLDRCGALHGLGLTAESGGTHGPVRSDELSSNYSVDTDILGALSNVPLHLDGISALTRRSAQATAAALLTLALENVVVEGPPGFFRRRDSK